MFVGAIYKNPELFIEYSQTIRSQYDFSDEATKFFYDCAEIMYSTRTQTFNKSTISTFMAEDIERLTQYKKFGGFKTLDEWIKLAINEDMKNYFEILKKYSLLREYSRNGFDTSKIITHKKFETFTAMDIYRLIRSKADRIHTVILSNSETEILNSNTKNTLLHCMEKPDMGVRIPFPIMNDIFRGFKLKSVMAVGMLSNAGKSRFMTKLFAYIALVLKEKVFIMLNEMSVEEMRYALITTVVNNPEFQKIHGIKLKKKEKELTLGLYKDKAGNIITQEVDEWGEPAETVEEYIKRVSENSEEFNQIMKITDWIDSETHESIIVKDVAGAYDDKSIEFELRKAALTNGIKYWFYDTCKQDVKDTGDWAAMKATVTKLTEISKELGMFGYLSIQLTDDTNFIKPDELNSSNIANCKGLKHVLHTLILFKEITLSEYSKYGYYSNILNPDWGEPILKALDPKKRYYCGCVDKNRFGSKQKILFELDLDLNVWNEIGTLAKK